MEKDLDKELLANMESINKSLSKIADATSVFKVGLIAFVIAALIHLFK